MSTRNLIIMGLVALGAGVILFKTLLGSNTTSVSNPSQNTNNPETTQTQSFIPAQQNKEIIITSSGFNPAQVTIKAGESVTWINQDTVEHQVNSSPHPTHTDYPPLNNIGLLQAGEEKSLVFPDKGIYKFHDHLNPQMFGSITVE